MRENRSQHLDCRRRRGVIGNLTVGIQDFVIPAPQGDFESIATVTVGSGGQNTITFSSIPSTFQHLQLRSIGRGTTSDDTRIGVIVRVNGDTGNNYSHHDLVGDGASTSASADTSTSSLFGQRFQFPQADAGANIFGAMVMDFLDYKDTNKYKTVRNLIAFDNNGTTGATGRVIFESGNWRSTSAITSITLAPNAGDFAQYSHFALYGIKG